MPIDMPMSFQFFAAVAKDVAEVSKVDATQFANAIDALQKASAVSYTHLTLPTKA